MDSKLLLVNCITLLYLENKAGQSGNSVSLCTDILSSIKVPEASGEVDTGRDVIVGLKSTITWMLTSCKDETCDKVQLLQRLRLNTKDDTYLYNAVVEAIDAYVEKEVINEQVLSYRRILKEYNDLVDIKKIFSQAYKDINFSEGNISWKEVARNVYDKLETYTHSVVDERHPSVVDSVSFSNEKEIFNMLSRSKEETSDLGTLKTGWQAVNRMLGDSGGFRRGEFVVVGALQHNYKTGFTLKLFKHFAMYNTPYMKDPNKKPLLIHISVENELPMNIMALYVDIKEGETGEPCNLNEVDLEEASKYIKEKLETTGYNIEMMRLDPSAASFHDIFDMMLGFEAKGYEIHGVVCDYLSMLSKQGLDRSGPTGTEVRELFRRMRNFFSKRGTVFITPHQLSTEAKALKRQGVTDFVKVIANLGYYEGSRQIDQEVDIELYIDIAKNSGSSFLTIQRGKHRKIKPTLEKYLYTVLPFSEAGGVREDIEGEDSSMKSVGGSSGGEGGKDWFDL